MDIKQFQQDVKALSQQLGTTTPERRIMYLVSELGEVVDEVIDFINSDATSDMQDEIKTRIGLEIYDLIWNAVDLANQLDIDLAEAFEAKSAFNAKRKWKHRG